MPVHARRNSVQRELLLSSQVLRQRLVLVLGPKRSLIGELQVHSVLDGGNLVVVVAGGPRDDRTLVHLLPVRGVERGRFLERAFLPQLVGA